jgi:hypothetical protein
MNGIIVRQNGMIEELIADGNNQNQMSQQRIAFLESHVVEITKQVEMREEAREARK